MKPPSLKQVDLLKDMKTLSLPIVVRDSDEASFQSKPIHMNCFNGLVGRGWITKNKQEGRLEYFVITDSGKKIIGDRQPTLKITKVGKEIRLEVLNKKRFVRYGKDVFLETIKDGEIDITREAKVAILSCTYKPGTEILGLKLFDHKTLAWGAPMDIISIHLDNISVNKGAQAWFPKCCMIVKK